MRTGTASGTQVALLIFAVLLLAVPLSSLLSELLAVRASQRDLLGRLVAFAGGALLIACIPPLRRSAVAELATPIAPSRRFEVLVASLARVPLAFAVAGATALWIWIREGNAVLEARMSQDAQEQLAYAFSTEGLLFFLLMGGVLAPLVEELAFRGFLFRAWERRWGWFPAMIGTSIVFGFYHSHFLAAFASSILLVCVLRRTGSIRAPILVHAAGNVLLWYPLAGQFLLPARDLAVGDISTWRPQLASLLATAILLPLYVFMARLAHREGR